MRITDHEFRALLDLFMASDPWPVTVPNETGGTGRQTDLENHNAIQDCLDRNAKARGFDTWVDAYHLFPREVPR